MDDPEFFHPDCSGLFRSKPAARQLGVQAELSLDLPGFIRGFRRGSLTPSLDRWCDRWISGDVREASGRNVEILRVAEGWSSLWYRRMCDGRSAIVVAGVQTTASALPTTNLATTEAILIRAGAFRAVIGIPANELTDRRVDLADVWGKAGRDLHQRLDAEPNPLQRVQLMGAALDDHARRHADTRAMELADSLRRIHRLDATCAIENLTGYSARQWQRLANDGIGLSPKQLTLQLRVRRVLGRAFAQTDPDWTRLALDGGFCDQSHLIHSWRRIYHSAPEQMHQRFRRTGRWVDGLILTVPEPGESESTAIRFRPGASAAEDSHA